MSCHGWTGESSISPLATLTGAWAVNDPGGTNVAQIVISGTKRRSPAGAFDAGVRRHYPDAEIAAVTNYVTARFGTKASAITEKDVAELRKQTRALIRPFIALSRRSVGAEMAGGAPDRFMQPILGSIAFVPFVPERTHLEASGGIRQLVDRYRMGRGE